jgi:ADP-ribosylglycohydrolase
MTLFSVEGLVLANREHVDMLASVHAAYQRWLWTQMPERFERPALGGLLDVEALLVRRAPGNTCVSALLQNVQSARVPTVTSPPNDSKGCGAIMRSAPFGLAATTRAEAFAIARDAGVLTHGHPSGYLSAAYFASVVFDLARDAPLDEAMREADALLIREKGHEETTRAIAAARAMSAFPTVEAIEALPNGGWVGEWALAIALACAKQVDVTKEHAVARAIWRAAAHGGDSDSTASLTGNLLGAMGAELPEPWLDELEMRSLIETLSAALAFG